MPSVAENPLVAANNEEDEDDSGDEVDIDNL